MPILELFNLKDDVAVVTGAGKGIGKGIAIALAEAGSNVVLASRTENDLNEVQEEIKKLGREAIVVPIDVTNPNSFEDLSEKALKEFGKISTWVNNAGGSPMRMPIIDLPREEWDKTLALNLTAVYSGSVIAARHIDTGSIINISTFAIFEPDSNFPTSSVFRSGLAAFTKIYSDKYAIDNIRMNNILPGFIDSLPAKEEFLKKIPLKRYGKVSEISSVVEMLASEGGAYITGQNIRVDGGITRSV